ncbi:hypothetical protein BASA81_007518 [Batrachochytrium salamandrivorans]|nr:hypothetical protein BASA81_007518 [Batrachochytrium salamandrivorans]
MKLSIQLFGLFLALCLVSVAVLGLVLMSGGGDSNEWTWAWFDFLVDNSDPPIRFIQFNAIPRARPTDPNLQGQKKLRVH